MSARLSTLNTPATFEYSRRNRSSTRFAPVARLGYARVSPKTASYADVEPWESQVRRSSPYPVSTTCVSIGTRCPFASRFCMKTRVAASAPPKTTSMQGPLFPPPSHHDSLYRTMVGSRPSRSVRNRWHSSTVRSFQYTGRPGKLNAWWAIISNIVKCWPVFPTLSMSTNLTHGWLIARGFAGGLASPLITHGWNGYTLAWTKKTSSRQRATIGYRFTLSWPFWSRKERKSSRIARYESFFLNGEAPMKSYSWHGVSPHVSCVPRDQKAFPHFAHVWRTKPWIRKSSTSYSLSGISASERAAGLKGSREELTSRPKVRSVPNRCVVIKYAGGECGNG